MHGLKNILLPVLRFPHGLSSQKRKFWVRSPSNQPSPSLGSQQLQRSSPKSRGKNRQQRQLMGSSKKPRVQRQQEAKNQNAERSIAHLQDALMEEPIPASVLRALA